MMTTERGVDAHNVQNLAYGSSSVQCATIMQERTQWVWICVTSAAYVKIGANPTASASNGSFVLGAGIPRKFKIHPQQLVAIIRVTADGVAEISEVLA